VIGLPVGAGLADPSSGGSSVIGLHVSAGSARGNTSVIGLSVMQAWQILAQGILL